MPRYSQNFLVNARIADFIIQRAALSPEDTVLEIGPGKGILTARLLEKCKVYAIEIDKELCDYLQATFSKDVNEGHLELICGDALKVDFPNFTKVVANIPYHISSPLLFKILEYEFERGILMLQYEFAERLVAKPGTKKYGRLSVMMYYNGEARILKRVKRGNFRPVPKVDSAIVEIVKRDRFCYERDVLDYVVRRLFEHRRKKIRNILGDVPYGDKRVEELSPEEICEVAKYEDRIRD